VVIKRKGTVARPGEHMRPDGTKELITWEELKRAVSFQNLIPLVAKHPSTGHINPNDRIGTVKQYVNEEEQIIEGEFWFYQEPECWKNIPIALQKKIINGDAMTLSAGYMVGSIVDGRQTSRQYDHIAIDVIHPMQNDGVGIKEGDMRMETNFPENFRIEETPTIEGEKKEAPPPIVPKTEPYEPVALALMIGELRAEVAHLKTQLEQNRSTADKIVEENRSEPVSIPEQEPPKPKTVVPQGAASKKDALDEDGVFRITG